MLVTELGRVTEVREEHLRNVPFLMLVIELGRMIEVMEEQYSNA